MRILLIQQDMGIREVTFSMLPIGLTYIASALSDYEVKIFDPNLYPLSSAFEELRKETEQFQPDLVGISVRNIDTTNYRNKHVHFNTVKPTIHTVKAVNKNIKIIVGGSGFSLFPEIIMEKIPEIDFGVYLEGEVSVPELIKNIDDPQRVRGIYMRKEGRVHYTGDSPLPTFSDIPMPASAPEVIDMKKYLGPSYNIIGIQTKRGCSLNCGYCSYPRLNGRNLRLRPPREVVDQIDYFINQFGMKRFVFVDSVFNIPETHAREILEQMIARNLKVEFGVWCHMKGISEEFLGLLKKAGAVQIDFSPDAATDKGLNALQKGLTEADIKRTIIAAKSIKNVGVGFGFFAPLPGYNFGDLLKTIIMPFKIQMSLAGRGGGTVSNIRIEPHTQMHKIAVKEGLINENDNLFPEDEKALSRMFYRPKSMVHLSLMMDLFNDIFERVLKPFAIRVYRILARLSGRVSPYDQKSGFVAFQRKTK